MNQLKLWEMPEVTGINRLRPRATRYPFQTLEKALTCDRENSSWFKPLSTRAERERPHGCAARNEVTGTFENFGWSKSQRKRAILRLGTAR